MAGKTDYQSDQVLNAARAGAMAAWTPYVALFSAAPSDAGGGTELTGAGGYARQAWGPGAPAAGAPGRVTGNAGIITFGPATGADWAQATHFAIMDALAAGNMRYWLPLPTPKTVQVGDTASFGIGTLSVNED